MTAPDPAIYFDFTQTCPHCGKAVQYTAGQREPHPCPDGPALVIEGCNASTGLVERVEQALADHDVLTATRDCGCGLDGEQRCCIDGAVYGPCDHEYCGGVCEYEGICQCACHKPATNRPKEAP